MYISGKYLDLGLLVLRIGLGITFIIHGYPKLFGGPDKWEQVGQPMSFLGFESAPLLFGFLAAITEVFGGIFLIFGLYMVPTLVLLTITMLVATFQSIGADAPYSAYSHPLKMAIVFISLLFIGAGKYSLDYKMNRRRRR